MSKAEEYLDHIVKDDFNTFIATNPPMLAFGNVTKDEMVDYIKKELEFVKIMRKYAKNNGWSDDWTGRFWDMKSSELMVVQEVLANHDRN